MTILARQTPKTPEVRLDKENSLISISGRSYPEDLHNFWDPIIAEIQAWIISQPESEITFDLNYHNSGSTRVIINLIRFCEAQFAAGTKIKMTWLYDGEDEQTAEQGEDYLDICTDVAFNLVEKKR